MVTTDHILQLRRKWERRVLITIIKNVPDAPPWLREEARMNSFLNTKVGHQREE